MIYIDLLIGFLEVGLFSFGGAYAAIPLIRDVVMAHGWIPRIDVPLKDSVFYYTNCCTCNSNGCLF